MTERETDQEIKDRQNQQLEEERNSRAERLGHDIRDVKTPEAGPSQNDFDAAK